MRKYINPMNNYIVTDGDPMYWLGVLLFGPLYFAVRGNWRWVFVSAVAAFFTFGISSLIIPFFTRDINREDLLRKGYKEYENVIN